mmetsp:Transcript_7014/g.18169  ORF Transcript_7014/g.18169 Transcript_7014/m.18169 type:complete len:294 (-) Transcript_7014:710-1591(-)
MLDLRLDARVDAIGQDLIEVRHVRRARLGDDLALELARGAYGHGIGGLPATVKPLQHVQKVVPLRRVLRDRVAVVARHLEESERKQGLVLPLHRLENIAIGGGGALHELAAVDVLLYDRVLDVRPEARVWEVGLPLGHQIVARAVCRRLGPLIHEVRNVPPGELGDAELEARGGHEERAPLIRADGHDHVQVLERERRRRVDDGANLVGLDHEAMILDKLRLVTLLEVMAAVERAAQRVVVVNRHTLRRVVLDQPQVGLRRVRRQRAIHLGLVQHRRREHVARIGLVSLMPFE